MTRRYPWKQRLLKIPRVLEAKVDGFGSRDVIVAAAKKIPEADVEGGIYRHLKIRISPAGIEFPESILPSLKVGPWSTTNVEGKEVVRKDLPMYTKTFAVETPNWGDASTYGTHTVYFDREVYPRDLIPPKHLEILIEKIDEEDVRAGRAHVLKFVVNEVLSVDDDDFRNDLLYNLNILQENIGVADVFESDTPIDAFRTTVVVNWEILPVGEREENLRKILSGVRSQDLRGTVRERLEVLERLKPQAIIRGVGAFQRYFGAQFADDLVVFENVEYGNAIYVMFEGWEELSRKSRLELLKGPRDGFERIVHSAGWEAQLEYVIEENRD